jgi:hypothetical protein
MLVSLCVSGNIGEYIQLYAATWGRGGVGGRPTGT